jgi:hypothetical protein
LNYKNLVVKPKNHPAGTKLPNMVYYIIELSLSSTLSLSHKVLELKF